MGLQGHRKLESGLISEISHKYSSFMVCATFNYIHDCSVTHFTNKFCVAFLSISQLYTLSVLEEAFDIIVVRQEYVIMT